MDKVYTYIFELNAFNNANHKNMSIIHNNAKLSNTDFFIGILILKSRHNIITITSTIERRIKCLRYFFSYSFKCIVLINNTPSYVAVLPSFFSFQVNLSFSLHIQDHVDFLIYMLLH